MIAGGGGTRAQGAIMMPAEGETEDNAQDPGPATPQSR